MENSAALALQELEGRLGLTCLAEPLAATLGAGPDPAGAVLRATQLLEALEAASAIDRPRLCAAITRSRPSFTSVMAAFCGVAPFLTRFFLRHSEDLLALCEDELSTPLSPEAFEVRLDRALAEGAGAEFDGLRRYKYYELARITLRDCRDGLRSRARVGETLAGLSHLADAILSRGLRYVAGTLEARVGPPRWLGADGAARSLGFCVLALGKLGGEELNYSSDVDLIYVLESPPVAAGELRDGPAGLTPTEYFSQLATEFGPLISDTSGEGFLYRIDLDLRPEGSRGPLVVSSDALVSYYDGAAATWERAAFMKARPVAGDLRFGWSVVRRVAPILHRSSMDLSGVAAIRRMKDRIAEEHGGSEQAFDVKTGKGGIRDIEFVVQALQLLHGGRLPQVRGRSTQESLRSLAGNGALDGAQAEGLLSAYHFLRHLENRLQMEAERQVHRLPEGAPERERLARAMGYSGLEAVAVFEQELSDRRLRVQEIFDALFSEEGADRILDLFARGVPSLLRIPSTRQMVEELAQQFARQIQGVADPELAVNNLQRFIQGIGTRSNYYGLLLDRPELVSRLAALFGSSRYLSSILARQPDLIEPVFSDPDVLLHSRGGLEDSLAELRRQTAEDAGQQAAESELAALRAFQQRELVNVGLLDLAGKIDLDQAEHALTEIAEVCIVHGLELARGVLERQRSGASVAEFLVVGMGKLGSRELSYGSDLDLIFLYDRPGATESEAQEQSVRLAQKFLWVVQAPTAQGHCYDVDVRLRPSGNQGMLVSSLDAFRRYHSEHGETWERQALLRARSVAGSGGLRTEFEEIRQQILRQRPPADLAAQIHRIRLRMENELARE